MSKITGTHREIVKRGTSFADTLLQERLCDITDGDYSFVGNYEIEWKIKEQKTSEEGKNG